METSTSFLATEPSFEKVRVVAKIPSEDRELITAVFNKDVIYSTTKGNKNRDDYYIRWANAIRIIAARFTRFVDLKSRKTDELSRLRR